MTVVGLKFFLIADCSLLVLVLGRSLIVKLRTLLLHLNTFTIPRQLSSNDSHLYYLKHTIFIGFISLSKKQQTYKNIPIFIGYNQNIKKRV